MRSGFHWFVAWRYLMARPRWGSPILISVAGLASVLAAVIAAVAGGVLVRTEASGRHALFAYENAMTGAVGLFGLAALALVAIAVMTMARFRERLLGPLTGVIGLMFVAGGLIAWSNDSPIVKAAAWAALGLGVALGGLGFGACYRLARPRGRGLFVIAGLLAIAGMAIATIAEYALEPLVNLTLSYPTDAALLPALGLFALGLLVTWYVTIGHMVGRRPATTTAAIAAILLAASAIYPIAAVRLLDPTELAGLQPPGLSYADRALFAGLALAGLGALVLFAGTVTRRTRPLAQVGGAILLSGGLLVGLAQFILHSPDPAMLLHVKRSVDQQVLLIAAVALACAQLIVVIMVIRYFFSFFTTVSIAGVIIGTMALIIVLSVMSGFENDLRSKILGSNAHILITKNDGSFTEYREVAARVADLPGVIATSPYLESEVVIAANKNYSNVIIKGVDPRTVGDVTELDENTSPGALERLWPLADDGSVQPPGGQEGGWDAGVPDDVRDTDDAGVDAPGGDDEELDPPPPDLSVDIDEPTDFSGGVSPDDMPDDDRPPADMDVDLGEPMDFSGGEWPDADADADTGTDADADTDTGTDTRTWNSMLELGEPILDDTIRPLDGDDVPFLEFDDESRPRRIPPEIARLPGVLVGAELVKQIHLYVGQEVRIISPLSMDTPAGPVPRTRPLRVADKFYSGMYEYDFMFVYVALDVLQAFLEREGEVTGIEVRVTDPDNTKPLLDAMRARLSDEYRVQAWQEINRSLFSALKLEKIAMFVVLAIIILVASFSIIGNLTMLVVEKAREIALIKTLGASNLSVMQIFITYGFFIGVVGTLTGLAHGLLACGLASIFGLPLNPEVYYIDRLPIHVEGMAVVAVAFAGVIISVIATLYPAYIGARLRPIEGLRYE